jgi:hypothetical protein
VLKGNLIFMTQFDRGLIKAEMYCKNTSCVLMFIICLAKCPQENEQDKRQANPGKGQCQIEAI